MSEWKRMFWSEWTEMSVEVAGLYLEDRQDE